MGESKMPAKIWAANEHPPFFNQVEVFNSTAYIRADLVEQRERVLVEALRKCALVCAGETSTKHGLVDALESARAALQAYEAGQ